MKAGDFVPRATTATGPLGDLKWVVLESALLDGETLLVVFEKRWLKEARGEHPGKVLYFPPEIRELLRFKDDPEAVRAIHRAKKRFKGWLVPSKLSTGLSTASSEAR